MNGSAASKDHELRERVFGGEQAIGHASESNETALSDDRSLIRLGKKPVLKRTFGFMSILGFSCTVLITWEGALVVSTQAFENGGPSGVLWGFLIDWVGSFCTFAAIAELASMAPTAGGQYHWVAMMAPAKYRNFLSYITAWLTVWGWQAVTASNAYLLSSLIQGLIVITHGTYVPIPWQGMLLFWAVIWFAVLVNSITSSTLARFEGIILVLHLLGFFAVLIPLVYLGPHGDNSVWTTMLNEGNWPTQGLSFLVGLPAAVFCLLGADSAVHMSEEIQNAAVAVPQALVLSLLINGALGFAILIALEYCLGDITAALASIQTLGYPFLEVFLQAVQSVGGAVTMASIVVVLGIAATVGTFAASTRMLWAFARDKGLPFHKFISKLSNRTAMPIVTIAITTIICMLLSLIPLGSSVAFEDILSLTTAGLYASYFLAIAFLLYRRVTGAIKPRDDSASYVGPGQLYWGPWRIPEPLGTINNAFACVYLVFLWFWAFWPPAVPVTPQNMNFSVVVFGGVVIFSVVWYIVYARHHYKGPHVEMDI